MTKLLEWITGGGLFVAVWAILLSKNSSDESDDCVRHFVLFLPIYAALAFAVSNVTPFNNYLTSCIILVFQL